MHTAGAATTPTNHVTNSTKLVHALRLGRLVTGGGYVRENHVGAPCGIRGFQHPPAAVFKTFLIVYLKNVSHRKIVITYLKQ